MDESGWNRKWSNLWFSSKVEKMQNIHCQGTEFITSAPRTWPRLLILIACCAQKHFLPENICCLGQFFTIRDCSAAKNVFLLQWDYFYLSQGPRGSPQSQKIFLAWKNHWLEIVESISNGSQRSCSFITLNFVCVVVLQLPELFWLGITTWCFVWSASLNTNWAVNMKTLQATILFKCFYMSERKMPRDKCPWHLWRTTLDGDVNAGPVDQFLLGRRFSRDWENK